MTQTDPALNQLAGAVRSPVGQYLPHGPNFRFGYGRPGLHYAADAAHKLLLVSFASLCYSYFSFRKADI